MDTGKLNKVLTVESLSSITDDYGDTAEAWAEVEDVRCSMEMVSTQRAMLSEELVGKRIYELTYWDNDYGDNIRFYDEEEEKYYYPIEPPILKKGPAHLYEAKVLVVEKI